MTELVDDLRWRGLLSASTDLAALEAALAAGPVVYYGGFDPTGPSLHHGHLVLLVTMRRFQLYGHRPIALVGGSTGLIGDPNPDRERTLNDPAVVAGWAERLRTQIEPFLDFGGPAAARMVDNLDWTAPLSALDFLRDVGRHFRVNKMIAKEAVAARLRSELGIGYAEFSYQILQALDYLELYRRHGCTLQLGGSDQWGNITAGVELIRRVDGAAVHALVTPLLTRADGTKYGKTSAGGAVWLSPDLLSPFGFYQYWLNLDDADIPGALRFLSLAPRERIEELEQATRDQPAARAAQRALAGELTALVHGAAECARVVAASAALFGRGDLAAVDERTLAAAVAELPTLRLPRADPLPPVVDLLSGTGLAASRSAARRTVAEGGAYLNNARVDDADKAPASADLLHGRWLVLRRGRRTLAAVDVAG